MKNKIKMFLLAFLGLIFISFCLFTLAFFISPTNTFLGIHEARWKLQEPTSYRMSIREGSGPRGVIWDIHVINSGKNEIIVNSSNSNYSSMLENHGFDVPGLFSLARRTCGRDWYCVVEFHPTYHFITTIATSGFGITVESFIVCPETGPCEE